MGKRINISTPVVIQTDLVPLSDYFEIVASDSLEQWYYVNTNTYAPDRPTTPLVLTPQLTAVDTDTGIEYTPTFYHVAWYRLVSGSYTEITTTSTSASYYISGNSLVVRANAPTNNGVHLKCAVVVVDPRDLSQYAIEEVVILSVNTDATIIYPTLSLENPPSETFNIFNDEANSVLTYQVKAVQDSGDVTDLVYFEWSCIDIKHQGQETLIENHPAYSETTQETDCGQGTSTISLDAMYAENLQIICRMKESEEALTYWPDKVQTTLLWEVPRMNARTYSECGSAVNNNERTLVFKTHVNVKGKYLTDADKQNHLRMHYKKRNTSSSTEVSMGWGLSVEGDSLDFKRVTDNVSVITEIELAGAYEEVTYNNEVVTYNNEKVYERN